MNNIANNQALQTVTIELLQNILLKVDQPDEFPTYATQEFLDLTAAGAAIMIECREISGSCDQKVLATLPQEAAELASRPAFNSLLKLMHDNQNKIQVWRPTESGAHQELLQQLGVGLSMGVPFSAGSWHAGGIVLFDLPDENKIDHLLQVFEAITQIFTLSLRNALLFKSQGAILDSRSKALYQHRASLQAFFDNKLVGMATLDREGLFTHVNQQWINMTGYRRHELLELSFKDISHPADVHLSIIDKLKQDPTQPTVQVEKRFIRKDGSMFWASLSGSALYNGAELIGLVAMITDITAHKQATEELRLSHDIFEKLTSCAKDGIIQIDHNGKVVFWNQGASDIFGYSAAEMYGADLHNILVPQAAEISQQSGCTDLVQSAGNLASGKVIELEGVDKNGGTVPIELSLSTFDSAGNRQAMAIVRDIRERKQAEKQRIELEEQLQQKCKMEAIGTMAGGIAHNFNNNLSIIVGNIDLAQLKIDDPNIHELLANAKIAVLRSRDLIKQIMTYSRKGIKSKEPVQLYPIIEETLKLLSAAIPSTVAIQQHICPNCPQIVIDANASQIQECLLNLCNNAVHAMQEQGQLTISLERTELHEADIPVQQHHCLPGNYAQLTVNDNGCGMDSSITGKIFDPFFTTKPIHEGTGMGLATVYGIVRDHGGMITVDSSLGCGTTFNLYFPIFAGGVNGRSCPNLSEEKSLMGSENILLVDDDELLLAVGECVLSEMGYQVVAMSDSREALKVFSANPDHFDLVISDQTMPHISGTNLLEQLRHIRPHLPTILCTGYSKKINAEEAKQRGISAFCLKPLDNNEFLQIIRQVLNN